MVYQISNYTTALLMTITILFVLWFFWRWLQAENRADRRLRRQAETGQAAPKRKFTFAAKRHPLSKKDALPMVLITAIYLAVTLFNLGTTKNPETFAHFTEENATAEIILTEPTEIADIWYYPGLYSGGSFKLSWSEDGQIWHQIGEDFYQKYNTLFKWKTAGLEEPVTAKYLLVELVGEKELDLGEIALIGTDGEKLTIPTTSVAGENTVLLTDEPDQVPETISFMNSTYFDEIYHARTAYEHLENVYPYEVSHPPLGKIILSIGISLFGMNTFGWRFMGAVFGAAMLPILYIFLKNLFGKTPIAVCGTILFAADFMHFAQTRIATIDTYSVFFVLLAFLFLYRYFTVPRVQGDQMANFKKELVPLALCGLFFGIGAASKWTVIYAALGLAILYFWNMFLRWWQRKEGDGFGRWMVLTILWSVVFFVVVPLAVYTASYLPYAIASGESVFKEMWDNQVFMLTYHNGVTDEHPYESRWWQWILNIRPILYYLEYFDDGTKMAIASFGNPLVVWGGLFGILATAMDTIRRKSGICALIFMGWLVQLVPWIIIQRTEFEYHYFGCILFLVLAIAYLMDRMWELSRGKRKWLIYGFTGYAAALFALFYPALSGLRVSKAFCYLFLKWLPSWPLG